VPRTNSAKEKENSDHNMWSQTAKKARGNHLGYFPRQNIHSDILNLLYRRRLKREERELKSTANGFSSCTAMSMSVCLSVCLFPRMSACISQKPLVQSFHMAVVRSSSGALCTSGFADDVMFSHNGRYGAGDKNRV